jgi:hypothetical protein
MFIGAATSSQEAFSVIRRKGDAVGLEFCRNGFGLGEQIRDFLLRERVVADFVVHIEVSVEKEVGTVTWEGGKGQVFGGRIIGASRC